MKLKQVFSRTLQVNDIVSHNNETKVISELFGKEVAHVYNIDNAASFYDQVYTVHLKKQRLLMFTVWALSLFDKSLRQFA